MFVPCLINNGTVDGRPYTSPQETLINCFSPGQTVFSKPMNPTDQGLFDTTNMLLKPSSGTNRHMKVAKQNKKTLLRMYSKEYTQRGGVLSQPSCFEQCPSWSITLYEAGMDVFAERRAV
jgi:hypothetical protein